MSARFDGSAAYLTNIVSPITAVPFSVGFWAMFTTAGTNATMFSVSDTGTTDDWFYVNKGTGNTVNIGAQQSGGAVNAGTVATADAVNTWFYVVARFISATNRRIAVLHNGGLIEHAQNTTSTVPTSIDRVSIGALDRSGGATTFWPGYIAELWYSDTDIQADGGQLSNDLLRQLAYSGPYPFPHIDLRIAEYHAMRSVLPNRTKMGEVDPGTRWGLQSWIDGGTTLLGPHPPLYANYQLPVLSPRPLVMI